MGEAVYCVAGRSAFLDGGLRFYKLRAETGELLAVSKIDENDPNTGENLQKLQGGWVGLTMPVANADILSSNGKRIFMRSQPFDLDGNRLRIAPDLEVTQQDREDAHLFSPVGLLDDAWHHRSYWMYGVTAVYGWHVWFEAAKHAPSGRILSFDDEMIYGFARKPQFLAQAPTIEYQLYKADKRPAADGPARVQKSACRTYRTGMESDAMAQPRQALQARAADGAGLSLDQARPADSGPCHGVDQRRSLRCRPAGRDRRSRSLAQSGRRRVQAKTAGTGRSLQRTSRRFAVGRVATKTAAAWTSSIWKLRPSSTE